MMLNIRRFSPNFSKINVQLSSSISSSLRHLSSKDTFQNTSNNEIEAYIANQTYGLEPKHLATISARLIRSPYTNRKQIVVWNEDLVKIKALEVYKNERAIIRAAERKNKIRKVQFEKIQRYIESSERSKKLELDKFKVFVTKQRNPVHYKQNFSNNENTNVPNHGLNRYFMARTENQIQTIERLIEEIDEHGGISFQDLILDEVIEIYEQSAIQRNMKDLDFVVIDHRPVSEQPKSTSSTSKVPSLGLSSLSRINTNPGIELSESATRVTLIAAVTNGLITIWKLIVALATNSATMYGEVYHSLGDTLMQIMLYMSHKFSDRYGPTEKYPYGFKQLPQIASLTSGVLIFSMGAWTSLASGFQIVSASGSTAAASSATTTAAVSSTAGGVGLTTLLYNPFVVLGVSFMLESYSLFNAYKEVKTQADRKNITFLQQLKSGTDPTTSVVFLEDMAAVAGIGIAASCIALMNFSGMILFDGIGSMGIGGVLAYISYKLTTQSALALMGKSVPGKQLNEMRDQLENDSSVRAVFDMKCTYVTPSLYRLKAEVEFDGKNVCDHYLQKQNLSELRRKMAEAAKSDEKAREFLLQHSSETVDQLGKDIDRIEKGLKRNHKDLRHIDLELN